MQSLGWCIGFALSPTSRLRPLPQLILTAVCCVLGTLLALHPTALPPGRKDAIADGTRPQAPLLDRA